MHDYRTQKVAFIEIERIQCDNVVKKKKKMKMTAEDKHHFLLVSYPMQSHINPVLQLAHRLTLAGVHVTFSTSIGAHRFMFPENPSDFPLKDPNNRLLSYFPYSDGYDDVFDPTKVCGEDYLATSTIRGHRSLHSIASAPSMDGKPAITSIIYAILISWVPAVASELGLPAAFFWIQPAAVFTIYYQYFHGCKDLITAQKDDLSSTIEFPGMQPIQIKDLPSFMAGKTSDIFNLRLFEGMFAMLDVEIERTSGSVGKKRPIVLVNSFESLEHDVLMKINEKLDVIPIGPMLSTSSTEGIVPKKIVKDTVDTKEYMEWLNRWPEKSVIYLSFGSFSLLKKKQKEEFSHALRNSDRPYLWVVRGDREGVEVEENVEKGTGVVVSWCSQLEVLSHNAVGCFVTHCGWNSTLEGIVSGVPMIGFPQWSDQATNAKLMEGTWKTGMRAETDGDGVVTSTEMSRCLETVMGHGERGEEMRENAKTWKEKARLSLMEGGSSDLNLMGFVNQMVGM